ncbi:hypothetical protein GCM10027346_18410 [Hymenobacter seoulensis]
MPLLFFSVAAAHSVAAQNSGPERRRRHYDGQARAYYRGPVRFTLGGGIGLYSGDLTSSLGDQFIGPSLSAGVLYQLHPHWQVGGEGSYIRLGAKDYLTSRGLAFQGTNFAGISYVRWEPFHDAGAYAASRRNASLVKPYVKAGVGLLLYNPKAFRGTTRPSGNSTPEYLGAERNDYPALAGILPVGVGFTVKLTSQLNAGLEGSYTFTTTDQLDDISPVSGRSSSGKNDGYGQVELKLEYAPWAR